MTVSASLHYDEASLLLLWLALWSAS